MTYFTCALAKCQKKWYIFCGLQIPELREVNGRQLACHFADELELKDFVYSEAKIKA